MKPERCVTCSDEALVARVLHVDGNDALVATPDGQEQRVALDLLADVQPGETVLCHAGIALERLEATA